jgi:DNA-binding MarR family transcriptional regulator
MVPLPMMLMRAMPTSIVWLLIQPSHLRFGCSNNQWRGILVSVDTRWLSQAELATWVRLVGVLELLPGVLDSQLRRDAGLTHFDYQVLAMLSEAPDRTLRMTALAEQTAATLARLSHVVQRLETRGLVERFPCPQDRRATNARLTDAGWDKIVASAPGHVATVRDMVIDALTPEQITQLGEIADAVLPRLDPDGTQAAIYRRYD